MAFNYNPGITNIFDGVRMCFRAIARGQLLITEAIIIRKISISFLSI